MNVPYTVLVVFNLRGASTQKFRITPSNTMMKSRHHEACNQQL